MLFELYNFIKLRLLPFAININRIYSNKVKANNYTVLKSLVDIRSLNPAKGKLRKIQIDNFNFAKEIVGTLQENSIDSFMIAGTLLGAERHSGFIPWDDDIDFGIMYENYEKMISYAESNFIVKYPKINRLSYLKSYKKQLEKYIKENPNKIILLIFPFLCQFIKGSSLENIQIVDFFPLDYYVEKYSMKDYIKFCTKLKNKTWLINDSKKEFEYIKKQRNKNCNITNSEDKESKIFFSVHSMDSYLFELPAFKLGFFKKDDIFPLKKMPFESHHFYAPKNHIKYLEYYIGENWDYFPDSIQPKHDYLRK